MSRKKKTTNTLGCEVVFRPTRRVPSPELFMLAVEAFETVLGGGDAGVEATRYITSFYVGPRRRNGQDIEQWERDYATARNRPFGAHAKWRSTVKSAIEAHLAQPSPEGGERTV